MCRSGGAFSAAGHAIAMPLSGVSSEWGESRSIVHVNGEAHFDERAEKFVVNLADSGIGFLEKSDVPDEERKAQFRDLLNANFDMNSIGRFALGRHWRGASKAQQEEYLTLFKNMTVDVYSARFKDYKDQEIVVTGSRSEGKRDILVHSSLKQSEWAGCSG